MKVVLYQPQIPQNTGNIVRTCSVTGCGLMLVPPLGFSTSDRRPKRAGLDYWEGVRMDILEDLEETLDKADHPFYFFSSKAEKPYAELPFTSEDWLIFGSETGGLPESFFQKWPDRLATIPMLPQSRCLNLATSIGIVVYEAWRQQGFTS